MLEVKWLSRWLLRLVLLCAVMSVKAKISLWEPDTIRITTSNFASTKLSSTGDKSIIITVESSAKIYEKDGGHFRVEFTLLVEDVGELEAFSECMIIGSPQNTAKEIIGKTPLYYKTETFGEIVQPSTNASLYAFSTGNKSHDFMVRDWNLSSIPFSRTRHVYKPSLVDLTEFRISDFIQVTSKKFFNAATFKTSYKFSMKPIRGVVALSANFTTSACLEPRTVGSWDDATRWSENRVPRENDSVVIPMGSGVILLERDVKVSHLSIADGLLVSLKSSCPDGWKINPADPSPTKCYKLYENQTSFALADQACSLSGYAGNIDGHLVEISGYSELQVVKKICRGNAKTSPARQHGCWIGLRDKEGLGKFSWEPTHSSYNRGFRDWRRFEPNNHTITEGMATSGELCTHVVPWQEDPLIVEQGAFDDTSCDIDKPYICQMFGKSERYTITVTGNGLFTGGIFSGGKIILNSMSKIQLLGLRDSATLEILETATFSSIQNLYLEDGSTLSMLTQLLIQNESWVGELSGSATGFESFLQSNGAFLEGYLSRFVFDLMNINSMKLEGNLFDRHNMLKYILESTTSMQPEVIIPPEATILTCSASHVIYYDNLTVSCEGLTNGFAVTFNAVANIDGFVDIDRNIHLLLNQGGRMSKATFNITAASSEVMLGGYAAELSTFDSFDLILTHSRPVIGEYRPRIDEEDQLMVGVYRLEVSEEVILKGGNTTILRNITQCIPYNATAQDIGDYLAPLQIVASRGGVTVRRYGDSQDARYRYGYTHRIELDSPSDADFQSGPMQMRVHCFGASCNCSEIKVSIFDDDGIPDCPARRNHTRSIYSNDVIVLAASGEVEQFQPGKSSGVNPKACVIPPTIVVNRVTELSVTKTFGDGTLKIAGGVHRLPHRSNVIISCSGGRGIAAANNIDWKAFSIDGYGTLVFAGTSWGSWDSANVLFMEEWEFRRGFVSLLDRVPPFKMRATEFSIGYFGSLYTASPFSEMTWDRGNWTGGAIGGRSTIQITEKLRAFGENKSLRYSCTLWIKNTAVFEWSNGNVSLSDGADIIMDGTFSVLTVGLKQFFGQALLLSAPSKNPNDQKLLAREKGRNWHGYFDLTLDSELRGGWYRNPLCGGECLDTNQFTVREDGIVQFTKLANASFVIPLNLLGFSRVYLADDGRVDLQSGGSCGNTVVVDMSKGTVLELSGGNFLMGKLCTIKGDGELLVSAGMHDMAFSIDAHITIDGGTLVWPLSRGKNGQIRFNGGLLMMSTGKLEIQPFSTTIEINKAVELMDDCIIQFPMIGIAAQAAPSDRQDAPDDTPRGVVNINGSMLWYGGTLRGKADINALVELFLDGKTKQIRSLAKLVNKGHAEWGEGDLVMDDNADFLNLGTMQMRYGYNRFNGGTLFRGTVIPVENGGDLFAANYHSWDQDQNKLSTEEYVRLRTLFVSKAPKGWSEKQQTMNEAFVEL